MGALETGTPASFPGPLPDEEPPPHAATSAKKRTPHPQEIEAARRCTSPDTLSQDEARGCSSSRSTSSLGSNSYADRMRSALRWGRTNVAYGICNGMERGAAKTPGAPRESPSIL